MARPRLGIFTRKGVLSSSRSWRTKVSKITPRRSKGRDGEERQLAKGNLELGLNRVQGRH